VTSAAAHRAVDGDLRAEPGRPAEFDRAAGLTADERVRELLLARAQEYA
jgi:hypothetical protein